MNILRATIKTFSTIAIKNGRRSRANFIALKLGEEVGELHQEVNIAFNCLGKTPGKDGVVGESCDVALVAIDQAVDYLVCVEGMGTEQALEEIEKIFLKKFNKARSKFGLKGLKND